jgi:hypothetical protein
VSRVTVKRADLVYELVLHAHIVMRQARRQGIVSVAELLDTRDGSGDGREVVQGIRGGHGRSSVPIPVRRRQWANGARLLDCLPRV